MTSKNQENAERRTRRIGKDEESKDDLPLAKSALVDTTLVAATARVLLHKGSSNITAISRI